MSQLPRARLAYANDCPSGERLGPVSTPDASVSCVKFVHTGSGEADWRPSHQAAATAASTTTVPAATVIPRARPEGTTAGLRATLGVASAATGTTSLRPSASANFSAVANRSAGSLASAVRTAASTPGGTVSRSALGAVGRSVSTLATIVCTVGPVNGGLPTSISYVTAPNA